ncbi:MAG TPA: glycine--tRNA ligase [Patescibacteria group bacterium]|nr:glycine--tRNA ligase [Patescibacteria group bacterium]
MTDITMEKIVALAKRRGFIYPGSDLYGGLANTYDYGPMGAELLRNIKNLWWNIFITKRADMVGLDASIISHHKIWEASGHVAGFADAMIDCKNCKLRMRADHLVENALGKSAEGLSPEELEILIKENDILCPNCAIKPSQWTKVRKFNQLFPVQLGLIEGEGGSGYLRGETAQGMFVNFQNVLNSTRVRLPFGIGQIGKSFRNEITPGNSIFRTIEFEQGEIEYFFDEKKTSWETLFEKWKEDMYGFITQKLGINEENLRWRPHTDKERSFYSKKTEDLEYNFPFGFKEVWGLAYRTNYDLTVHQEASKKDLTVTDPVTNEKILPHVIEPAVGINRLMLMLLCDTYTEEENRTLLRLPAHLAPVKAAVFPLLPNKPELVAKAREVLEMLEGSIDGKIMWDDRGNIGKRYLSQDEIGTPFCITIDFDSLQDNAVTVRDRDSASQERIVVASLMKYLQEKI